MENQIKNQKKVDLEIDFFKLDLKTKKQQKTFEDIYKKNNGDWSAIKSELTVEEGFTAAIINNLEFTHHLAEWSKGNKGLISFFKIDDKINSMRDIAAKFNKAEFIEKVKDFAPEESEEDKKVFAINLYRELFFLEPTTMLVSMIKDPKVPMLNDAAGANVAAVLEKLPDFNIKTTSIYEVIKNEEILNSIPAENHEMVIKQLKIMQRITAVSPEPDALPVLYNANFHSAMQISAMPQRQFMNIMSKSGLDRNTLMQIHSNAQQVCARNEHAIIALKEAYKGTRVAMIDKSMNETIDEKNKKNLIKGERDAVPSILLKILEKHNLSWDLLFGDTDFCECDECNSVYSATAYYVELLQYLRNNNLDHDAAGSIARKTDPKDISGTPLEKLFARRPDLGCLELTCKNTNTTLPYIDLINEVMENYVAFKHLKPFNVEDEDGSELLAEPQHTEYQAYCILKNEVYPFTLPYHQPIDAERIYLKHLDTSRYELIKTFRKNNSDNDAELTRLKDEALDREADAEFLGLTTEEYVILTKECYESKALMDKLKNKIHTDDEYQKLIGVKPVCKYYGFDDDITMQGDDGLTLIKKEFLHRTGIDYFNLVDLLKTQYINPYMPKGKAKTIMDSLHFSYRFLQNYARAYGIDKMAEDLAKGEKLADFVPLLKELIQLSTNKKVLSCPESSKDDIEISDKDIICWVKYHFEKVGKMIVIESARGRVNGKILKANQEIATIEDHKIFFDYQKKKIEIANIDRTTGKILFKNSLTSIDKDELESLCFIGNKGEKGVFLVIGNDIYLVYVEQKDNCDPDAALLRHLDGTHLTADEYDRIHRFIRLWRKLGWTIDEVDQAIMNISISKSRDNKSEESISNDCREADCDECEENTAAHNFDIKPNLVHQLVAIKKLLDITGLELIKLLSFWSNISTTGEKSLYQQLFLTRNVLGIDKIFKADDNGNYLTTDVELHEHIPAVMAALNLFADDIHAIMQASKTGDNDKLTMDNLSILYRYRLLSKVLGLGIPDFVSIMPLYGEVFKDAHASLEFVERWNRMEQAGLTHQHLNYIIRGVDDESKPFTPTQKNILQISKTLYDGLNEIDKAHKDLKADASIIDPAFQKKNIGEQATSALIRSKASLVFETDIVEKIIGILEGTNVFTTKLPNKLNLTLSDTNTLKNKLKYFQTPDSKSIQITGILTEDEVADYKAISNSYDWVNALTRIQKQQDKLFKELLLGVFEGEKTKTNAEKAKLEAIIKAGDIIIPLDKISEGEADTNTAPRKRAAFLEIFLPYLRQQLSRHFVIDTLSNFTGLETRITDVLISDVLRLGSPVTPIYDVFEKIKESTKPEETNWSGYLIPAAYANYTFIIKNSDIKPTVSIDGEDLDFRACEDPALEEPAYEWWSETKSLQAGKLYKLAADGTELKNIFWKIPSSAITSIPSSALMPDFASEKCKPALIALKKAALFVSAFDLSADEIEFLDHHKNDFDNLSFNTPTLAHWLRIEAYMRLRNSLPQAKTNILDFWNWVYKAESDETKTETEEIIEKIVALTTWKKERIVKLIAANHFNIGRLEDYRNEKNLLKLQKALTVADKIGIDIDLLFKWAAPVSNFNTSRKIADSIKNAIRAKYSQADWEQVAKPLHDQLRNNQKEALIGYLLQQKELIDSNVIDADGLYEHFLIDVQMEPSMETSRIKQAISSVQLFVQRCFLGLEEEHNGIRPDELDRARWDWMQHYRIWEANRKVFLYPENWIESNLRDDKSPFFKELESELLQKDINKQNVADALKFYLYKVDEVANMEVVGLYVEMKLDYEGKQTNIPKKLHVFSRKRNAPYFFYYRFYDAAEKNWYSWEKIQIDIPSYDVEDPITKTIIFNGCYLTPVVWNGRLLIFFPHFMKKTKINDLIADKTITKIADDSPNSSKPVEYWEIKMAWSEYRNDKWTQKQLSKDAIYDDPTISSAVQTSFSSTDISKYKFVPVLSDDTSDNDKLLAIRVFYNNEIQEKGKFEFNGNSLQAPTKAYKGNTKVMVDKFHYQKDDSIVSLQTDDSSGYVFHRSSGVENFSPLKLYHAYIHDLNGKINLGQLKEFFEYNLSIELNNFGLYDHDDNSTTQYICHELKRPYSLYSWELFFHTPILLADALSKAQHFEEAMKWFHYVFNPIAEGNDDKRFWRFKPFRQIDSQRILDSIFNNLKPNKADKIINEWRNKAFMPHVVARSRPVAYMKWVIMKYIDNLLSWGDYLFRQDTIESINQATQLYILAGHILGPKPMMIPKRGKVKPQTYLGLLDKWDAFGNAMVELELIAPFSNQTALSSDIKNKEITFANIFGLASSLYFSIPRNPKLMGYWDTLADRLYKIRHCQNIQGVFRKLPLFEPPIDPALLVKAAAQSLSIASVLSDLNTTMPNYRFYYLLQKALELCSELKSLGSAMLTAIEKNDNETIALIRAKHEGVMHNMVMEIKKKQLEEAHKSIESLMQNRKTLEARMKYYLKLSGLDESYVPVDTADFNEIPNDIVTVIGDSGLKLIKFEKEDMDKASEAQDWQRGIGIVETTASIMHLIPELFADVKPFGIGAGTKWGGINLGNAANAVARGMQVHASDLSFASSNAGKKGGFTRALQERIFQANAAGYELKQIDKQITAQEIRINIADQEIANQQKAIDNANEVEEFIKNKYSNEELYIWMRGGLKTLYHKVFNLAYELAKKAEKTYCFERGISNVNFIQSGYFDAGRDGLLAGEQLYVGLKQLEAAYQNERGYDYEITKQISLYQINPLTIIHLRETGKCEFIFPEILFDMDYPGHYRRRIKSVSVSIPCIVGPYTGINATLSLLENKFRNTAIGGKAYEENTEETDGRFSSYNIPINAIAASSAQSDSGMFELNFKDERYLPFEGAGVISKWRLELPVFRQFDYNSISDVIIHLKYTACEAGERLKSDAVKSLSKWLGSIGQELYETGLNVAINMKHNLPNEWLLLKRKGTVDLKIDKSRLPYMVRIIDAAVKIQNVIFVAKVKGNPIDFSVIVNGNTTNLERIDEWKLCRGNNSDIDLDKLFALSIDPAQISNLEELVMVVKYSFILQ